MFTFNPLDVFSRNKTYMTSDELVIDFWKDAIKVIQKYDRKICNNLIKSKHADFYDSESKGILVWSVSEPIIKFIVFSELCLKYKIFPEYPIGKGKRVDLAIYKDDEEPEIGIEMKWGLPKKKGEVGHFTRISNIGFENDCKKLSLTSFKNQYFVQISWLPINISIKKEVLEKQVHDTCDFECKPKIILTKSFLTEGFDNNEKVNFALIVWKVN